MERPTIVLLTDFGNEDNFVGIMKGVIKKISPTSDVIDLTHSINPQNLKQAAFILSVSVKYFPQNTIFISIVDPGVGSSRNSIAVKTKDYTFISPDNGTLSYVMQQYTPLGVYSITNSDFFLSQVSATFHGRDIYAPLAAHLANGLDIEKVGERISPISLITLSEPKCFIDNQNIWHGEVMHIDRFGNIMTSLKAKTMNIEATHFSKQDLNWIFETGNIQIRYLSQTFSDVNVGNFLAYVGSFGYIEIGKRDGSASDILQLNHGDNIYAYRF